MRNYLIMFLGICIGILEGCSRNPERLPNGQTYIQGNGETYTLYYVHERDGNLVYAFIPDPTLTVVSTNNPDLPIPSTGIHRLTYSRDGVWVNGKKVITPDTPKVFAIRKDGSVHPVACNRDQLEAIGPNGGITDPIFVKKVLLPALGSN